MPENTPRTHLSSAPWKDGERSFSTKNVRLSKEDIPTGTVFEEKDAFFAIQG
jgi:hypothetical protein